MPVAADRAVPRPFVAILLTLLALKATAYWWGSWLVWPDDPFSTFVIYRGQDIQALPLIRALSGLNVGEAGVLEWLGSGVSARIVPYLPHAALLALAGPAGFVIGDVVITLSAYYLLARIFVLSGAGPVAGRAAAALLVGLTANDFGEPGFAVAGVDYLFWGLRIPRPFLSDLFGWAAILGALLILRDYRAGRQPRHATLAAVGVGGSLLLQSDVFTAGGLGLGLLAGAIVLSVLGRVRPRVVLGSLAVAGAWAALVSAPLIIGLARMPRDAAERLGMFPVARLDPPFVTDVRLLVALGLLVVLAAVLTRAFRGSDHARTTADSRWLFLLLAIGALLALPVSSALLGQATQIYHYPLALIRSLWLAAIVIALQIARVAVERPDSLPWPTLRVRRTAVMAAIALVIGPCLVTTWRLAAGSTRQSGHMRVDVPEWAGLTDYRRQFVDLIERLPASSRTDPVVLATFDHQLWSWWLTFGRGYSYLADACTTTLPDAEIESRLITFARLIGMTRDQFLALMERTFMLTFWHSCARFQANALYARGATDDYDESDRLRIAATRPMDSFSLVLPISERRRLGERFDSIADSNARLDLIVLTKADYTTGLGPPPAEYEQIHDNAVFTLWRRRE